MQPTYPTIIWRHRKENLNKCSLRGLESRSDLQFFLYPTHTLPCYQEYILLDMEGPPLGPEDGERGLLILDGTWRYAEKMSKQLEHPVLVKRSIPKEIRTAYPRRQEDCFDPERGLASVEALYVAYHLLGWDTEGLLDHYHWKREFLDGNRKIFSSINGKN